jgi:hypothetical protein
VALTAQGLALGAAVVVPLWVVEDVLYGEKGGAFALLGQGSVGTDAGLLYGRYEFSLVRFLTNERSSIPCRWR